ncbi:ATP-binding protein [soil metagenome]
MIQRKKYDEVSELLDTFPAVALLGPRQVGKTTLAMDLARTHTTLYLDLESEEDRAKLANPAYYLASHQDKLVIMDEVQRMPQLFQELRGIIDKNRRAGHKTGQFLLLGSASMDLLKQSGESLAGRIAYCELFPWNLVEYPQDMDRLWVRGGFPDSVMAASDAKSMLWRKNFIRTYLERDIPQLGPRIPAETLRRFWTMLAHLQGTTINASQLAGSLGVDGKTVMNYLDLLVDLLLVRRLQPYHGNHGKRLIKSPKVYVRDSGLLHALLGIDHRDALLSHPVVGMSWEGFVIENICSMLNDPASAYFYRTSSGNEIDLLLQRPGNETWAVEVKRSLAPKFSKGYSISSQELGTSKNFIIYPGTERYAINENTEVISLAAFLELL